MKIIKLQAENFKKLKAVEIVPQDRIIEITGRCEQGKTTVLDAIQATLCGQKSEEPIREGQSKGKVVIDLGDKVVTRTFTKSGGTLKVESKDGAKYPSPQKMLDSIVGKIAFNPLEFSHADSKKQVDMLLAVVDLKVDAAKLKSISGVSVEPTPNPLDMLNMAHKEVFEERTLTNRQLDQAKKILDNMPVVSEIKPVVITDLISEKEKLENTNIQNNKKRNEVKNQYDLVEQIGINRVVICNEIKELENQLVAKRDQLKVLDQRIKIANEEYEKLKKEASTLKDKDLSSVNERIANADKTNLQAKQYNDYQQKQQEVNKFQAESDNQTSKLDAIKKYKAEIINKTKFPVPNLDFANGGVVFEGKPFSQASGAQKIRVGMGIGMAANPELRVVMIDGYEALDSQQRKIVEEMATEHDFQVWCTAVDESGTVGIYLEDGEIKTK